MSALLRRACAWVGQGENRVRTRRFIPRAGLEWDPNAAHSAIYDAQRTAALFCIICNKFRSLYEDACERAPQLARPEPRQADEEIV